MNNLAIEKELFITAYPNYGYNNTIDNIRLNEFPQLTAIDSNNNPIIHFDHAGSTIPNSVQLNTIQSLLLSNVYSNPHSNNNSSQLTQSTINTVESNILSSIFNTTTADYTIIFISSVSAGCELLTSIFPFNNNSEYSYLFDNHNSIIGMRELIHSLYKSNCTVIEPIESQSDNNNNNNTLEFKCACGESMLEQFNSNNTNHSNNNTAARSKPIYNLFAFPAESNFDGSYYDLSICNTIAKNRSINLGGTHSINSNDNQQHHEWYTLIDASKYCTSRQLDLSQYSIDFTLINFYKIFGFPTGLGALIINNSILSILRNRSYFSGGSINYSLVNEYNSHSFKSAINQRYTIGTENYLGIISINAGLDTVINRLQYKNIYLHTQSLKYYIITEMQKLHYSHSNQPLCKFYSNTSLYNSGSIINFNLYYNNGQLIPYNTVEILANSSNISIRSGQFCNPGAVNKSLGLNNKELLLTFQSGHSCSRPITSINNKITGSIRLSIGWMNTFEDSYRFIQFLKQTFIDAETTNNTINTNSTSNNNSPIEAGTIDSIYIYPIKSCAAVRVNNWFIDYRSNSNNNNNNNNTVYSSLYLDREWTIINSITGVALTAKQYPELLLIQPVINIDKQLITLSAPTMNSSCSFNYNNPIDNNNIDYCELNLCGLTVNGYNNSSYYSIVNQWLSDYLRFEVQLIRRSMNNSIYSNEPTGQYLLINSLSIESLSTDTNSNNDPINPLRFRPNFLLTGNTNTITAYSEDEWLIISINNNLLFNINPCIRCSNINLDPITATTVTKNSSNNNNNNLLKLLNSQSNRIKFNQSTTFGILLTMSTNDNNSNSNSNSNHSLLPISIGSIVRIHSIRDRN